MVTLDDPASVEHHFVEMLLPFIHPEERDLFVAAVREGRDVLLRSVIARYRITVDVQGTWGIGRPWPSCAVWGARGARDDDA